MRKIIVTGNAVTIEQVEAAIERREFVKVGAKIMICHLTLKNGHEVIGYSGVVDHSKFDRKIGESVAFEKAKNEVWKHLGTLLQNQMAEETEKPKLTEVEIYIEKLKKVFDLGRFDIIHQEVQSSKFKNLITGMVQEPMKGKPTLHFQYTKSDGDIVRIKYPE